MSTPRAHTIGSKKWDKVMYAWQSMLQESFEKRVEEEEPGWIAHPASQKT